MARRAREVVEAAVREHNAELAMRGRIAIAMGLLACLGVYAAILMLTFMLFGLGSPMWFWMATVAAAVFIEAGWWSASRGEDPLRDLRPPTACDHAHRAVSMVAVGVPVSRYAMTGLSAVLIHGPASMREGFGLLAARVTGPSIQPTLAPAWAAP